jgi:hypothetical protein
MSSIASVTVLWYIMLRQLQYKFEIEADGMVKNIMEGLGLPKRTIFRDVILCTTNISEEHTAIVLSIRLHSVIAEIIFIATV